MILPFEEEKAIQEILESDVDINKKAFRIEDYYKSKNTYNRVRGRKQPAPILHYMQIKMELQKRGEDLTPLDIDL